MDSLTLTVSPDDEYLDVWDIPVILAKARYPDTDAPPTVSALDKIVTTRPQRLDHADCELLRKIWCNLPEPVFPMQEQEWQRYKAAFADSPDKPAWELVPLINSPQVTNSTLRMLAVDEYRDLVREAAKAGTLQVLSKLTLAPIPIGTDIHQNLRYFVTPKALAKYVRGLGMSYTGSVRGSHAQSSKSADATRQRNDAKRLWKVLRADSNWMFRSNRELAEEIKRSMPTLTAKVSTITANWITKWTREEGSLTASRGKRRQRVKH